MNEAEVYFRLYGMLYFTIPHYSGRYTPVESGFFTEYKVVK